MINWTKNTHTHTHNKIMQIIEMEINNLTHWFLYWKLRKISNVLLLLLLLFRFRGDGRLYRFEHNRTLMMMMFWKTRVNNICLSLCQIICKCSWWHISFTFIVTFFRLYNVSYIKIGKKIFLDKNSHHHHQHQYSLFINVAIERFLLNWIFFSFIFTVFVLLFHLCLWFICHFFFAYWFSVQIVILFSQSIGMCFSFFSFVSFTTALLHMILANHNTTQNNNEWMISMFTNIHLYSDGLNCKIKLWISKKEEKVYLSSNI